MHRVFCQEILENQSPVVFQNGSASIPVTGIIDWMQVESDVSAGHSVFTMKFLLISRIGEFLKPLASTAMQSEFLA